MPKSAGASGKGESRYKALLEKIFFDHYRPGDQEVIFERGELTDAARDLNIVLPKNIGDAVYSVRYRTPLPAKVAAIQPSGYEWVIDGKRRPRYACPLPNASRIVPHENLVTIMLPDATPEGISAYALSDEQALLAKVRYNRLIDIFLGIAAYSLQSHLRTFVKGVGQIEIDEIYTGLDRSGRQFVVPVQAKGGNDKLSSVQATQDIACCNAKFPTLICRAISAQFMADDLIALFELTVQGGSVKIVDEAHYRLVPSDQISAEDLAGYRQRKNSLKT